MENEKHVYPVEDVLDYLERMAENKLDSERRREESIIQQAGNMQAAFSFTTAALFMVAVIVYDNSGAFSTFYLLFVFASITVCLIMSLLFATVAQNRMKTDVFPSIKDFYNHVDKYHGFFITKKQRIKYYVDRCADAQSSLSKNNEIRVKWLKRSMRMFYVAMTVCAIWSIISLIIIVK